MRVTFCNRSLLRAIGYRGEKYEGLGLLEMVRDPALHELMRTRRPSIERIAPPVGFDAASALDLIERHQCSYTMGLPSLVQFILEEQTRKPRNVRSL